MLLGGLDRRTLCTVLLAAMLLASGLGTAIGAAPAAAPDERAADAAGPGSATGGVHPDLRDAEGEVTAVVRFPELGNDRARAQSRRDRGMEMRSHAADTQAAFDEFVADRPAVRVDRSFWVANAKLVTVDTDRVGLAELASVDGVREIHPNYRIEASAGAATAPAATAPAAIAATSEAAPDGTTGDGAATTYGLEQIRAPEVWDRFGTRGAGVSVAVLDTGVDPDHPDLDVTRDRWAEFDDHGDRVDSAPYDSATHGTHTSGTVVGGDASGTAIGVAPDATLYHGKVLDGGTGTWASAIAGVEWAATEAEVDVVSMSLGGETYHSAFVEPIRQANDLGVIVVASAGNTGVGSSNSPGNVYDTVSVGAVDSNPDVPSFSSGERVDTADDWGTDAPADWPDEYVVPGVAAPGVGVWSAEPGGGYGSMSGTSMAAPHVAGTVALIRAAGGDHLTQAEMRDLLQRTASKPAGEPEAADTRYGAGVVDAYRATVHGAADSTVTGRVVDEAGDPVVDSRVDTEFDYGTATDGNASYALDVPSLEQTLTVEAFGYESQTFGVAPDSETLERDLALTEPTLAAREAAGPPQRVDPGETVTHEFAVSNVTSVTVATRDGTAVERGDVTLRVDGEEVAFGEERTYADPRVNTNVTVEVATSADAVGTLELDHAFSDGTATVTRTTDRTHVHPDPFRVPADYDPADLQSAVDVAAPGTTVVVDERATGAYVFPVDESAAADSGLSIDAPMTLRAADGAAPAFLVADHDPGATEVVGVDATAPGVTLRGIHLDANGADVGVRTGDDATVEVATVSNATVALDVGEGFRGRGLDLGDGRPVDLDASNVAVSPADDPAPAPEHHERVGPAVAVESTGTPASTTLSVPYEADDVTRVRNESLRLWRYDESAGEWTRVDRSAVDESAQRVDGTLDAPGTVAPMGEQFPAEFDVDRVEAPPDVVAGETLTVNATVTNRGVQTATQDVALAFDGAVVDAEPLTLAEGETGRVSLSHVVDEARDGGTVGVGVTTTDDANRSEVEVYEPARFGVRDLEAPGAAERTDRIEVSATVENTGDFGATQDVELRLGTDLDGDAAAGDYGVLANDSRTLGAGESTNLTFAVDVPTDADTGALEVGVASADDDARAPIDVFRVSGTLEGTVSNATTQEPVAGATVTATANESGGRFTATTDDGGAYALRLPVGRYDVTASADGYETSEATTLDIVDDETTTADHGVHQLPLFFAVDAVDAPTGTTAGDTVAVTATVTNLGASAGERTVELRVGGERVAQETVRLDAGAATTVDLSFVPDAAGTVEVVAASQDDRGSTSIDITARETDDGDSSGSTGGGGSGSGGGGIGGGGGGAGPPGAAPPPADEGGQDDETADAPPAGVVTETADIVDAAPDRPGVTVALRNTTVSEITFRDVGASGTLTVREGVSDDLPAPPGSTLAQLAIDVPVALADRPATIEGLVDADAGGDGDLTLYRHADGEWRPLETTVRATDAGLVVEAETPGFSRFALVRSDSPGTPTPTDTPSEDGTTQSVTETQTPGSADTAGPSTDGETDATSPTEDDGAGFGVVAGLVAALVGLLAARRATR